MVICGFTTTSIDLGELWKLGVKDSKKLSKRRRWEIAQKLMEKGGFRLKVISPIEIDKRENLNELEAKAMAKMIEEEKPGKIYIDSPDRPPKKFLLRLKKYLKGRYEIVVENKADEKYLVVAAASIIAKHVRDLKIEEIKEKMGDLGSGYPSDIKTIKFLEERKMKIRSDDFVRKTWKTAKKIIDRLRQKKINEYL